METITLTKESLDSNPILNNDGFHGDVTKTFTSAQVSDEKAMSILMHSSLDNLPLMSPASQNQPAQMEVGFMEFPENEMSASLADDSDHDRVEEAMYKIHYKLVEITGDNLTDGRSSSRERAESIRWFLLHEEGEPSPLTFEACCLFFGANPDDLRRETFRQARKLLKRGNLLSDTMGVKQ